MQAGPPHSSASGPDQGPSRPTPVDEPVHSNNPAPPSAPSPSTAPRSTEPQHLIILCGLIGSGKSTFARALATLLPNWVRANQDILGTREAVALLAWRSLSSGSNVIVDRTNVDVRQRRTWLQLGKDVAPSLPLGRNLIVSSVTFDTPLEECERRLRARTDHETLHDPIKAVEVLNRFCSTYTVPTVEEGYHCCVTVRPDEMDVEPTREQVQAVVRRIEESEKAEGILPLDVRGYGWGDAPRGRGNGRGRGRGRGAHQNSSVGRSALFTPHGQAEGGGGGGVGQTAYFRGRGSGTAWGRPPRGRGGVGSGAPPPPPSQIEYDATSGVPPWRQPRQSAWLAPRPPSLGGYNLGGGQAGPMTGVRPPPPPPPPPPPLTLLPRPPPQYHHGP